MLDHVIERNGFKYSINFVKPEVIFVYGMFISIKNTDNLNGLCYYI